MKKLMLVLALGMAITFVKAQDNTTKGASETKSTNLRKNGENCGTN